MRGSAPTSARAAGYDAQKEWRCFIQQHCIMNAVALWLLAVPRSWRAITVQRL